MDSADCRVDEVDCKERKSIIMALNIFPSHLR